MTEIQWYYARDDQRFGPVSTVELKRLADRGQLAPNDLVWREGMTDWAEAGQVKGLFHAAATEAAAATPFVPQGASPVAPGVPPSHPAIAGASVSSQPTAQVAVPPVAGLRPVGRGPLRHPVEAILAAAHKGVSRSLVDATVRLFVLVGHWSLYAAMVLCLVAGTAASLRERSAAPILWAAAAIVVLLVLQYAAGRFCEALDRVKRSTRAAVVSTTLLDLLGLASMALALGLLLMLAAQAAMMSSLALVFAALLAFVLGGHLAAVLLVHVDEHVVVSKELSPGEEALGTLCALLKTTARTVPVAFGVGVCIDTVALLIATVGYLAGSDVVSAESLIGRPATIFFWASLPILGYLAFLLLALLIDILDGLLTLRHPNDQMPLDQ